MMMSEWLRIPAEERTKIRKALGIPRTLPTKVEGGVLVSDGVSQFNLDKINEEVINSIYEQAAGRTEGEGAGSEGTTGVSAVATPGKLG